MIINDIADALSRGIESVQSATREALFEPVIRLGVTGLSRAGKTVFITSLVANLMDRARMPGLIAAPAIEAAYLQPQPDDTIPRFAYEDHYAALTARTPRWPESTRQISQLRLSLRVRPSGFLSGLSGPKVIHLDIIDYPGEWLLDLALLERSYASWSELVLGRMMQRPMGQDFLALSVDPAAPHDEPTAQTLAESFTAYLQAARAAGFSDLTPGRFLLPGEMAGSPVLTFAPMTAAGQTPRGSLYREMERRYDAYRNRVVRPFFRDHFARLDRQVVLVDALGAINAGPQALEDLRQTMADILTAFRPGRNAILSQLLLGKRVERILFAATKADHIHHTQHPRLTAIMEALVREARQRADFAGARTQAMSLAALRATTEDMLKHDGAELPVVRGRVATEAGEKQAAFYPGELPEDPNALLGPAREGAPKWLDGDFQAMRFLPQPITLRPGEGPPHIRLDRAAEFLFGDKL